MNAVDNCHVMAKPSGSICNLDCKYCFYLEKHKLYPDRNQNWRMSDETLQAYIRQTIDAQSDDYVQFAWQGGEPTLMGLDFFENVIKFCDKYANGKHIEHTFQTNGILLNDAWCLFFKKHNFLIGISIDGPADLHDNYRVTCSGKPTHAKVMKSIELLKKHQVSFNTLTVINRENVKHPKRMYEFLKEIGSTHLQFIPLVEREAQDPNSNALKLVLPGESLACVTEWSVPSLQYGEFLSKIFDIWIRRDVGRIFVNMFDSTLSAWFGEHSGMCHFVETCGHAFALEANGDLYNCDHFVYPEHLLGNIHHVSISEMNRSKQASEFGQKKATDLTQDCVNCKFKFACHGGCPKHRFAISPGGEPRHNYFCQGYKYFFQHSARHMAEMRDLLQQGRSPADIMMMLAYQEVSLNIKSNTVGRNEPCPCGSGKKYKRCCG